MPWRGGDVGPLRRRVSTKWPKYRLRTSLPTSNNKWAGIRLAHLLNTTLGQ